MRNEPSESGKVLVLGEDELFHAAAKLFANTACESVRKLGIFAVALAGGSTPKRLYSLLAKEFVDTIPWDRTQVFFGDERCVPPDRPDSNYRMAEEHLLSRVGIPPGNIYRMKGESEPNAAAVDYSHQLMEFFKLGPGEFPQFDLILLGMGEDGHTASLFPGSDAVTNVTDLVAAPYVPKLNTHRLTLTPPVLTRARRVMVLVTGASKAQALEEALRGPYEPDRCPAQILRTAEGDVVWFADPAAAGTGTE